MVGVRFVHRIATPAIEGVVKRQSGLQLLQIVGVKAGQAKRGGEKAGGLRDEFGLSGVGAHTLRHSAAVAWLESGVHIRQVADLLGHSSISITGDIYGHGSDDGARAAVLALGARLDL